MLINSNEAAIDPPPYCEEGGYGGSMDGKGEGGETHGPY